MGINDVRNESSHKILVELEYLIDKYPELRFTQLLHNIGIEPDRDFYEEPHITLNKIIAWRSLHERESNKTEGN